jgi:hypothetical protein
LIFIFILSFRFERQKRFSSHGKRENPEGWKSQITDGNVSEESSQEGSSESAMQNAQDV